MTAGQAHLVAATHATGSHLRGWRHPDAPARPATDLDAFVRAVQELERGCFDAVFLGETTGVMPGPGELYERDSMVNDSLDPTLLLAALAATSSRIGLVTTASTSLTQPRSLAQLLASLDHLSGGRAGWNVVTSRFATEARNFGLDPAVLRSPERYAVASEFVDVVMALWDGREGDVAGTYFSGVRPLDIPHPPQGRPVVLQAGSSEEGRQLSARVADVVLAPGGADLARATREDVRRRALAHDRDPDEIVVLGVVPAVLVAETRSGAESLVREFAAFLDPEERRHHGVLAGTAREIADLMEGWLDAGAADGFAVGFPWLRGPVEAFVGLVVPELQRRGRFRAEYRGSTLREHLGIAGP